MSDPVAGCTVSVPAFVPEAGVTVNHVALSVCVQLSVEPPWPVFDTATVCEAGFDPPTVALKVREVGLSPIAGVLVGIEAYGSPEVRKGRR